MVCLKNWLEYYLMGMLVLRWVSLFLVVLKQWGSCSRVMKGLGVRAGWQFDLPLRRILLKQRFVIILNCLY